MEPIPHVVEKNRENLTVQGIGKAVPNSSPTTARTRLISISSIENMLLEQVDLKQ
jgi:hypothetical protein